MVDVGLAGTVTVTITGGGGVGVSDGSVVVGAAEFADGVETTVAEVGAQGVPTSSKAVVIVIQASSDCFDIISTATLSTTAGSFVTM